MEIQYILLLIEILITAWCIKTRPIAQYYLQSELDAVVVVKKNEDSGMIECKISFLGKEKVEPVLQTYQTSV